MVAFYRNLRSGQPAEEALRTAMGEIRETQRHPYHWAPFIVVGGGGPIAGAAVRGRPGRRDSGLELHRTANV
jgi:hypothetical protein